MQISRYGLRMPTSVSENIVSIGHSGREIGHTHKQYHKNSIPLQPHPRLGSPKPHPYTYDSGIFGQQKTDCVMHAATLHLLTLLATVAFDAAHCFVLPNKQLVFDSRPLPSGSNEGHWNGGDIVASRVSDGLNDMPPQLQQEMGNTFKSADRSVYDPGVGKWVWCDWCY